MRKILKKFTLMELLIVIVVIVILVAILTPVAINSIQTAKKTKAKAEMNAIATAIKSYDATYGVYPIPSGWSNGNIDNKYSDLMSLLTNISVTGSTEAAYTSNARNIRFLDVPQNFTTNNFKDPWGNFYLIYLDTDYDGQVAISPSTLVDISHRGNSGTLYGDVFIYSTGNSSDPVNYVYSW